MIQEEQKNKIKYPLNVIIVLIAIIVFVFIILMCIKFKNNESIVVEERISLLENNNETSAYAYIENNKVKVKYGFGDYNSGTIDIDVNDPKKLYSIKDSINPELGYLVILTVDNYIYVTSFDILESSNEMGELIKFNNQIKEINTLNNQLEIIYQDDTNEILDYVKLRRMEIPKCTVVAENSSDFLTKLQNINDLESNCGKIEVSWMNLKYISQKNDYLTYSAYKNSIYYNNKELEYISNNDSTDSQLINAYLLNNINGQNTFLFIFSEVPVTQTPKYYIIIFNENGKIEFLKEFNSLGTVAFNEETKELSYTEKNINCQIPSYQMPNEEMCNYIKKYNEETLYIGKYIYRYETGEMNLINSEETTIGDLNITYCHN